MFPNLTSAIAGFSTYLKNSPGMLIDLSFGSALLHLVTSQSSSFLSPPPLPSVFYLSLSLSPLSSSWLTLSLSLVILPFVFKVIVLKIIVILVEILPWVNLESESPFQGPHPFRPLPKGSDVSWILQKYDIGFVTLHLLLWDWLHRQHLRRHWVKTCKPTLVQVCCLTWWHD